MGQSSSASAPAPEIEEIKSGNHVGLWKTTQPLTGYKRVNCDCKGANGVANTLKFIANVTIPAGSQVVRPYHIEESKFGDLQEQMKSPSDKLRSDQLQIDDIMVFERHAGKSTFEYTPTSYHTQFAKCTPIKCRSVHDGSYAYEPGAWTYKPKGTQLNTDVETECTSGLYFFLGMDQALNF